MFHRFNIFITFQRPCLRLQVTKWIHPLVRYVFYRIVLVKRNSSSIILNKILGVFYFFFINWKVLFKFYNWYIVNLYSRKYDVSNFPAVIYFLPILRMNTFSDHLHHNDTFFVFQRDRIWVLSMLSFNFPCNSKVQFFLQLCVQFQIFFFLLFAFF